MEFDDQLRRYFGTTDLSTVTPAALVSSVERMSVDFGLEKDPGRRFALWAIMYMLGTAPDLEIAFEDENDLCGWLPHCKCKIDALALVGCRLLSGLFVQLVVTAGPDGVREPGPILQFRL
jgi:hypothetical protein